MSFTGLLLASVYSSTVFLLLNLWTFPSTPRGLFFLPLSLSFFFSPRVLQCTLIVAKNKRKLLFNPGDRPSPFPTPTLKHTHNNDHQRQRLFCPYKISTALHTHKTKHCYINHTTNTTADKKGSGIITKKQNTTHKYEKKMSQGLQRSASSPATVPLRRSEKSPNTTTFMPQPTSDDNWVFFPQPSFSDMNDDEDDEVDEGEDELENRRIQEERNGWVTALWGRIFRAKSWSASSSVNGDYEKDR